MRTRSSQFKPSNMRLSNHLLTCLFISQSCNCCFDDVSLDSFTFSLSTFQTLERFQHSQGKMERRNLFIFQKKFSQLECLWILFSPLLFYNMSRTTSFSGSSFYTDKLFEPRSCFFRRVVLLTEQLQFR